VPPPDRALHKQMFFQLFGADVSTESGHWNAVSYQEHPEVRQAKVQADQKSKP